jgi:transposase
LIRLSAAHPDWVLGFEDEVWFSRWAQPNLYAWTTEDPLRLIEREPDKTDLEPKAMACYGLLRADTGQMWLRFVDGRPVSSVTTRFLGWLLDRLAKEGKTALLLVWDNASWHISKEVRSWIREHNHRVKQNKGCRLLVCRLPSKSPWLNNIEPKWAHGKRAVVEPDHKLSGDELKTRLCDYYACDLLDPIPQLVS